MFDEMAWFHSSSSGRCLTVHQGSVRASQPLPHQTHQTMSLWTLLFVLGNSHFGTEEGRFQTVAFKI